MRNVLLLSAVGLAVTFFAGCDFTQKYCERAVDCVGEDLMTIDACVEDSNRAAEDADTAGCANEYDAYATCSYKNSTCEEGEAYNLYSPGELCNTELDAYVECISGTTE